MHSKLMHLFHPQCQDENSKDKREGAMYQGCVLLGDGMKTASEVCPKSWILSCC